MAHRIYFPTKEAIVQSFIMQNTYLFILSFVITHPFPESGFTLEVVWARVSSSGSFTLMLVSIRLSLSDISDRRTQCRWSRFTRSVVRQPSRGRHAFVRLISRENLRTYSQIFIFHLDGKTFLHFLIVCYVKVWRLFNFISAVFAESFLWFFLQIKGNHGLFF